MIYAVDADLCISHDGSAGTTVTGYVLEREERREPTGEAFAKSESIIIGIINCENKKRMERNSSSPTNPRTMYCIVRSSRAEGVFLLLPICLGPRP